jgi:DNA-directed RNA polymerase specialized sigma24 family protein
LHLKTDYESLSDLELLELLCSSTDDTVPYAEFAKRFLPDLQKECKKVCKRRKLDPHIGTQIAHECLESLRKFKSFTRDKIKIPDERKAILVYLYASATNRFNDYYNAKKRKEIPIRSYFDDIQDEFAVLTDAKDLKKIKEFTEVILKKLTARERIVVLKDSDYKRHQKYLPDEVTTELVELLRVKPDSIRKIRERAITKIKNAINEINQS